MEVMPVLKYLWVAKELMYQCANFRVIPEKKFDLLTPEVWVLEKR